MRYVLIERFHGSVIRRSLNLSLKELHRIMVQLKPDHVWPDGEAIVDEIAGFDPERFAVEVVK